MFHRSVKKIISSENSTSFAGYLLQVTTNPENFPAFLDSKKQVVMPRVARAHGLTVNDTTKSIDINREKFHDGNYSHLTIKDELNDDICAFNDCSFVNASLAKSDFSNARMTECYFDKIDFSGSNLNGASVHVTNFHEVILDDANFSGALLLAHRLNIESCSFARTNLLNTTIDGFNFLYNRFSHLKWSGLTVRNAISDYADNGAFFLANLFTNVSFDASVLTNAGFEKNRFDNMLISDTDLSSSFWELGATFPGYSNPQEFMNIFRNTSMDNVNAWNAMIMKDIHGVNQLEFDGIERCPANVRDYFINNNVTITGNSRFGTDNPWNCVGVVIATCVAPFPIILVIACIILLKLHFGRHSRYANTSATQLRLFDHPPGSATPSTPLLSSSVYQTSTAHP